MNLRLLVLAALLCSSLAHANDDALVAETKKTAMGIPPKLLAMLQAEIEKGNFSSAIDACADKAPKMAAAASQSTGWSIRRVSLKNRNPKATPDAWERDALLDFDSRVAAGESPATLEKVEFVNEGDTRTLRYIKALPTQGLCLSCHGAPERISPEVKAQIAKNYPNDLAVGYREGQVRGALTIKRPL